MNAAQKILEGIGSEAKQTAESILADAAAKAKVTGEDAKRQAKAVSAQKVSDALRRADAIKANAASAAELIVRDAKLARKRKEIAGVLESAKASICALDDEAYFDCLTSMAAHAAEKGEGVFLLGARDLLRNIGLLEKKLSAAGLSLTVSRQAADIDSGFVLKYGDIELNLSFEALIHEKRERLEDTVGGILFAE